MTRAPISLCLLLVLGGCNKHTGPDPVQEAAARAQAEAARAAADAKLRQEAEERARAEAQNTPAAQMRRALRFRIVDKGFQAKDLDAGRYDNLLYVNAEYENTSGKEIRAFSGDVHFKDENGTPVMEGKIKVTTPFAPAQKDTWRAQKVWNSFSEDDVRMKDSNMAKVRMFWEPRGVAFADGTVLGTP